MELSHGKNPKLFRVDYGCGLWLGAEKNPKPEKYLKMLQNPTCQVRALLGGSGRERPLC